MPEQFVGNPHLLGADLVVLTRREYNALLRAAKREQPQVADSPLPFLVADQIAQGVHILTALREWRGLSKYRLCQMSLVSQNTIADCELRGARLRPASLERVASALQVPVAWLKVMEAPNHYPPYSKNPKEP